MEVIVGKTSGFCAGVRNAVMKTEKYLDENKNSEICCLGEIVHNATVVNKLKNKGLKVINDLDEIPMNSKCIIRAHGVPKKVYDEAKNKNISLYDLTCPKVTRIHDIVKNYVNNSKYVVIVGNPEHPEVIGIKGFCENNFCVIDNIEDVDNTFEKMSKSGLFDFAIVSQTTQSVEKFNIICNKLLDLNKNTYNIEINNTICNATNMRQQETLELSKKVDLMIVIGGKNSSNTRKLYDIALKNCKTILVSDYNDFLNCIEQNNVIKYSKIGVMGGASTPKESIDLIVEKLCKL